LKNLFIGHTFGLRLIDAHKPFKLKGVRSVSDFDQPKWPARVFFSVCSLILIGCVWYLWTGARNPEYYWQPSQALALESPEPYLEKEARVVLAKNRAILVGDARIVYRGLRKGVLHLDLFALQLDPHYGYPHEIDMDKARQGFRMGDHHFKVLAASDGKISLWRM
jgi:hypothetical protein